MTKNRDLKIVSEILSGMTLEQRREWIIKMRMAERRKNFSEIAKRHRYTRWLLADAVHGNRDWTPRIIKALQDELCMDLLPLLKEKEAQDWREHLKRA